MNLHSTRSDTRPNGTAEAPSTRTGLARIGGIAALVEAATFIVGIAMFATMFTDYTGDDATPASSVAFLVDNQAALLVWYLVIYVAFGVALVPLTLAVYAKLKDRSPGLAQAGAAFGLIWSGVILATGMISNIGLRTVSDLAETDAAQAESVWSAIDAVTNGLGGGNELVGGVWVLLVSIAGLRCNVFTRGLNRLGLVSAVAGLVTLIPGFEVAEMLFGLGLIVWFAWLGTVMIRDVGAHS